MESLWLRDCDCGINTFYGWKTQSSTSVGIQGQIAQQDDIQLLLKLILEIYGGEDYSCIRMHHFRALAPKPPPPHPNPPPLPAELLLDLSMCSVAVFHFMCTPMWQD